MYVNKCMYICVSLTAEQFTTMKAQINKVNEGAILVSLFNEKRIVSQKWFTTKLKAVNFCKKYNYEVGEMPLHIDEGMKYEN